MGLLPIYKSNFSFELLSDMFWISAEERSHKVMYKLAVSTAVQWYYNNGNQEVVTSINFVTSKTIILQNFLNSNPHWQVLHFYAMLTELLIIRCEQLFLINQFMPESNL